MEFSHIPVLKNETIELLNVKDGGVYFDGTLGGAGHSKAIQQKAQIKTLIGVDQDIEALDAAKKNLSEFDNVIYVNDNFRNIDSILDELNVDAVDGILVDIGVSSYQIDAAERGFSFRQDAKLDMRMDKSQYFSAFELVNNYSDRYFLSLCCDIPSEGDRVLQGVLLLWYCYEEQGQAHTYRFSFLQ